MVHLTFRQIADMLVRTLDGAMLVNETGEIVVWNKAAERLLGYRAQEVLGRPCHDVLEGRTLGGAPLCSISCPVGSKLAHGGGVHNFDLQTHTKTGRLVWLNISSLPVPSRTQGRFLAMHFFRDITEQARMRRLVKKLSSMLDTSEGAPQENLKPAQLPLSSSWTPGPFQQALPLSAREREILDLLASGKNTKSIADTLYISPATVRNHVQHILSKLGAHSRLEALTIAFRSNSRTA